MKASWIDITRRATQFAKDWQGVTYEKGESQTFWGEFFQVFGIDRRRVGASFEYPALKNNKRWGFIDLFYPQYLLVEHKSTGKDLDQAQLQAFQFINELQDSDLPEAIVVCDFASFRFISLTERNKTINFPLEDLPKHVKLFGFLIGQTTKYIAEQDPVNLKAAESMAELHNKLRSNKYRGTDLEILLVRLVFLMFAEDSSIFERSCLLEYITKHTKQDGSDLGPHLIQIFEILNTPKNNRQVSSNEILSKLPYVNGLLFNKQIQTPLFNQEMRRALITAMELDWSKVSPAIFGSMFQGVMDAEQRRNLGAHYTSEVNILKVIKPLFLDDLYKNFRQAMNTAGGIKQNQLRQLHDKIANLKFLDPACGCGNFLVITYRELRKLEHKILMALSDSPNQMGMLTNTAEGSLKVEVSQMYGIEIEEFPALIAQTALWLTDHQMNMEYNKVSGAAFLRIPLTTNPTIVNDNALNTNWETVIDPQELNYILGNPPFIGSQMMTPIMRQELTKIFPNTKGVSLLDYVSGWYAKAASVMKQNSEIKTCLVSTNSITQGQQVAVLWKYLFNQEVIINFAHRTFKWSNDAKGVAAVYCVIVGFSLTKSSGLKSIYVYKDVGGEPTRKTAHNINGYLLDTIDIFIEKRSKPLFQVPEMHFGNMPLDGGNLLLTAEEKQELIDKEPKSKRYIKKLIGAKELLQGEERYCLWLLGVTPSEIKQMPMIQLRIEKVRQFRLASRRKTTRISADRPTEFGGIIDSSHPSGGIVVPSTSSENRQYIPMAFFGKNEIVNNSCHVVPGGGLYHFGILTSKLHMDWVKGVAGRLESRYRYSKDVVYNNFVWPDINNGEKREIEKLTQIILDVRAKYSKEALGDLYNPTLMPQDLNKAHQNLDKAVYKLYELTPDKSEIDRIEHLFILHQSAKLQYE